MRKERSLDELLLEIEELRARLEESEETLRAIRNGEVDAIVASGPHGEQIFTLKGADHPYRVMVEQMSEAAVTLGSDGVILFCNSNLSDLVKYSMEHLLGRAFQDLVLPDDQALFDRLLRQASRGKAKGEVLLMAASGKTVPVRLSLSALHLDDTPVVSMLVTDLSGQKEAEALREREELFRTLAENSPDLIARYDKHLRYIYVNPSLQRYFAFPSSECIGKTNEELGLPEGLTETWNTAFRQAADTRRAVTSESMIRFQGEAYLFHTLVVPEISDGEVISFISLSRDISDRRRLEEGLRQAKQAADEANRAKSEFLANMSHEIRTPMNGIIGMTQLALMEDISPRAREYLQFVRHSGKALLEIINDILDLSKIESGKATLERKPFRLRESLESTLRSLQVSARDKGLEFYHSIDLDLPDPLLGDQGRLRQVLTNLIGNAIKFTAKGAVRVSVAKDQEPARPGTVRLLFRVRDDGIGIPRHRLEEIFEAFSQIGLSSHIKYGGTGLGLSISKNLVEMMGGRIWVNSEIGKGSTFSFTAEFGLVEKMDELDQLSEQPETPRRTRGLKILLAEDNQVNRLLAVELLKMMGHEVEVAENGREALEQLRKSPFDLVLMDVRMPDMDGLTAVKAVRRGEAGPDKAHTPVVALTAYALKGDRERFLEAGMDDYLSKPIDLEELNRVLERALKRNGKGGEPVL